MSKFEAFDKVLPSFSVWSLYYGVESSATPPKVLFFSTEELMETYKNKLIEQYGAKVYFIGKECKVNDKKEYGDLL